MKKNNVLNRKEKIVQVLKQKNRLSNVPLADLRSFAKKHIDPKITTSTRKYELLPLIEAYLTADTLLECAEELPRFGLALCDLPEALDISKLQVNELVDANAITLLTTIHYTCNHYTIYVFSIKDAVEVEIPGRL